MGLVNDIVILGVAASLQTVREPQGGNPSRTADGGASVHYEV